VPASRTDPAGELSLDGRVAAVTGGARGIGRAIGRRLAAFGAELLLVDLDEEAVLETAEQLAAETGATVRSLPADVASERGWAAIAAAAPRLDALVNNAGLVRIAPLAEQSREDWRRVCAVNLDAALEVSRALLGALRERGGAVVNVASVAALHGLPGSGAYGPSKAALVSLTEQLAGEWGRYGIRVNAVAPGLIRTEFAGSDSYRDAEVAEARARSVPLGRLGEPEDVAGAVHYLLSDLASYVSGETLVVDGGWRHGFLPGALAVGKG
jgi:NAD(P)-dependent dehydrogenase (short-subunit alcohol dehydrogenase family)